MSADLTFEDMQRLAAEAGFTLAKRPHPTNQRSLDYLLTAEDVRVVCHFRGCGACTVQLSNLYVPRPAGLYLRGDRRAGLETLLGFLRDRPAMARAVLAQRRAEADSCRESLAQAEMALALCRTRLARYLEEPARVQSAE